jgi:hypothetical protein
MLHMAIATMKEESKNESKMKLDRKEQPPPGKAVELRWKLRPGR